MRLTASLDFPLNEYKARLDKLLTLMEKNGFDALFLTAAENLRYFTGLQSVVWSSGYSTPGVLIITCDGKIATVSSKSSLGPLRATTWVEESDMFTYGMPGTPKTYEEAIFNAFSKLGVQNKCIGMEFGTGFRINLQTGHYLPLKQRLCDAGATLSDASKLIWSMRTIKSDAEIEYIRKAVVAAEGMFDAAFDSVVLGQTTERDLMCVMGAFAMENECEDILSMVVRFGLERMMQVNCPSSDTIISNTPHAILHLDGGPCYKGYYADIIRQAVVIEMTPEQKEYEKINIESMEAGLSSIREGVSVSEISKACDLVMEQHGLADVNDSAGWTGHGIGLDVHEEPQLAIGSDYILKAGMTLSVEPGFKIQGLGSFCNEQNIVVTKTGYDLLSTSPLTARCLRN